MTKSNVDYKQTDPNALEMAIKSFRADSVSEVIALLEKMPPIKSPADESDRLFFLGLAYVRQSKKEALQLNKLHLIEKSKNVFQLAIKCNAFSQRLTPEETKQVLMILNAFPEIENTKPMTQAELEENIQRIDVHLKKDEFIEVINLTDRILFSHIDNEHIYFLRSEAEFGHAFENALVHKSEAYNIYYKTWMWLMAKDNLFSKWIDRYKESIWQEPDRPELYTRSSKCNHAKLLTCNLESCSIQEIENCISISHELIHLIDFIFEKIKNENIFSQAVKNQTGKEKAQFKSQFSASVKANLQEYIEKMTGILNTRKQLEQEKTETAADEKQQAFEKAEQERLQDVKKAKNMRLKALKQASKNKNKEPAATAVTSMISTSQQETRVDQMAKSNGDYKQTDSISMLLDAAKKNIRLDPYCLELYIAVANYYNLMMLNFGLETCDTPEGIKFLKLATEALNFLDRVVTKIKDDSVFRKAVEHLKDEDKQRFWNQFSDERRNDIQRAIKGMNELVTRRERREQDRLQKSIDEKMQALAMLKQEQSQRFQQDTDLKANTLKKIYKHSDATATAVAPMSDPVPVAVDEKKVDKVAKVDRVEKLFSAAVDLYRKDKKAVAIPMFKRIRDEFKEYINSDIYLYLGLAESESKKIPKDKASREAAKLFQRGLDVYLPTMPTTLTSEEQTLVMSVLNAMIKHRNSERMVLSAIEAQTQYEKNIVKAQKAVPHENYESMLYYYGEAFYLNPERLKKHLVDNNIKNLIPKIHQLLDKKENALGKNKDHNSKIVTDCATIGLIASDLWPAEADIYRRVWFLIYEHDKGVIDKRVMNWLWLSVNKDGIYKIVKNLLDNAKADASNYSELWNYLVGLMMVSKNTCHKEDYHRIVKKIFDDIKQNMHEHKAFIGAFEQIKYPSLKKLVVDYVSGQYKQSMSQLFDTDVKPVVADAKLPNQSVGQLSDANTKEYSISYKVLEENFIPLAHLFRKNSIPPVDAIYLFDVHIKRNNMHKSDAMILKGLAIGQIEPFDKDAMLQCFIEGMANVVTETLLTDDEIKTVLATINADVNFKVMQEAVNNALSDTQNVNSAEIKKLTMSSCDAPLNAEWYLLRSKMFFIIGDLESGWRDFNTWKWLASYIKGGLDKSVREIMEALKKTPDDPKVCNPHTLFTLVATIAYSRELAVRDGDFAEAFECAGIEQKARVLYYNYKTNVFHKTSYGYSDLFDREIIRYMSNVDDLEKLKLEYSSKISPALPPTAAAGVEMVPLASIPPQKTDQAPRNDADEKKDVKSAPIVVAKEASEPLLMQGIRAYRLGKYSATMDLLNKEQLPTADKYFYFGLASASTSGSNAADISLKEGLSLFEMHTNLNAKEVMLMLQLLYPAQKNEQLAAMKADKLKERFTVYFTRAEEAEKINDDVVAANLLQKIMNLLLNGHQCQNADDVIKLVYRVATKLEKQDQFADAQKLYAVAMRVWRDKVDFYRAYANVHYLATKNVGEKINDWKVWLIMSTRSEYRYQDPRVPDYSRLLEILHGMSCIMQFNKTQLMRDSVVRSLKHFLSETQQHQDQVALAMSELHPVQIAALKEFLLSLKQEMPDKASKKQIEKMLTVKPVIKIFPVLRPMVSSADIKVELVNPVIEIPKIKMPSYSKKTPDRPVSPPPSESLDAERALRLAARKAEKEAIKQRRKDLKAKREADIQAVKDKEAAKLQAARDAEDAIKKKIADEIDARRVAEEIAKMQIADVRAKRVVEEAAKKKAAEAEKKRIAAVDVAKQKADAVLELMRADYKKGVTHAPGSSPAMFKQAPSSSVNQVAHGHLILATGENKNFAEILCSWKDRANGVPFYLADTAVTSLIEGKPVVDAAVVTACAPDKLYSIFGNVDLVKLEALQESSNTYFSLIFMRTMNGARKKDQVLICHNPDLAFQDGPVRHAYRCDLAAFSAILEPMMIKDQVVFQVHDPLRGLHDFYNKLFRLPMDVNMCAKKDPMHIIRTVYKTIQWDMEKVCPKLVTAIQHVMTQDYKSVAHAFQSNEMREKLKYWIQEIGKSPYADACVLLLKTLKLWPLLPEGARLLFENNQMLHVFEREFKQISWKRAGPVKFFEAKAMALNDVPDEWVPASQKVSVKAKK